MQRRATRRSSAATRGVSPSASAGAPALCEVTTVKPACTPTWARRVVVITMSCRTVFPWVASRSRTPTKLLRVDILQHGYEYAQLNTACWPDWPPQKHDFEHRTFFEPRRRREAMRSRQAHPSYPAAGCLAPRWYFTAVHRAVVMYRLHGI